MIKLLLLSIGAAAVAASAATAVKQKSLKAKKDSYKLPEQTSSVVQTYNEPVAEEYEADYMFI